MGRLQLSGGKASGAASHAVNAFLDGIGHPRARRLAIHADLGRIEWRATAETVAATAAHLGVAAARRPAQRRRPHRPVGDAVRNAKQRYAALETYRLIARGAMRASASATSELMAQVMGPALAKRCGARR